jgi:hypothetical protein
MISYIGYKACTECKPETSFSLGRGRYKKRLVEKCSYWQTFYPLSKISQRVATMDAEDAPEGRISDAEWYSTITEEYYRRQRQLNALWRQELEECKPIAG